MSILKDIKADFANIVISMLCGSGSTNLDETETLIYDLFKHILERTANDTD